MLTIIITILLLVAVVLSGIFAKSKQRAGLWRKCYALFPCVLFAIVLQGIYSTMGIVNYRATHSIALLNIPVEEILLLYAFLLLWLTGYDMAYKSSGELKYRLRWLTLVIAIAAVVGFVYAVTVLWGKFYIVSLLLFSILFLLLHLIFRYRYMLLLLATFPVSALLFIIIKSLQSGHAYTYKTNEVISNGWQESLLFCFLISFVSIWWYEAAIKKANRKQLKKEHAEAAKENSE